ncbi:hypothetical protein CYMTET_12435 [Cymbomonas tetramitiformis]|uniref:F-box domain-containing protein n=1 Tax=Cymbomonas tetramitiformis TaxID=36881 RepID=A0AAE0LCG0_9CHLO|nr:hypothetical protein CYMTET_12435 [Cymbomonas tetramitiformis]
MHNTQNLILTSGSLFSKRNLASQRPSLSELPYGIKNPLLGKRKKEPLDFLRAILAEDAQIENLKRQKNTENNAASTADVLFQHRRNDTAGGTVHGCAGHLSNTLLLELSSPIEDAAQDFSFLPNDVLQKIFSLLKLSAVSAAGSTCRAWREAARPAKQALELRRYGRAYKRNKSKSRKKINHEKALTCFLRAARGGCLAAATDAGVMLWENGKKEEAASWYTQAAEGGDPTGACNLGLAYLSGDGVRKDLSSAISWLTMAATSGNARAAYQLGLCSQHGNGTLQDMTAAAGWYKRSAEWGNMRAMHNLALCHRLGRGEPL